ncbi:Opioid growth factor receptor (OGFr) conserved region [Halomonas sp. KO116]|nr:Opioid growth factor receptor (OGFr) conserved region [Halomonas sp. KO116]
MLDFLGWNAKTMSSQPNLSIQTHTWLKAGGHNHLRITRMILSLALCHAPELAQAFQKAVIDIGTQQGIVSETSVQFWRDAI